MPGQEDQRLREARSGKPWRKWGPYLSERQWGTVREDYSENGNAWDHFPHEQARSRAYRWGEDGIAGISDDQQRLCFAVALFNGRDPIIKERMFGLANEEGNHGEDVKEYYFYESSTPTHSYMRHLYKYPQSPYPYAKLVEQNSARSYAEPEYELVDTGVFDERRYFDVVTEYAKVGPCDLLIRITICNRGPDAAGLELLPTLWFRNDWRHGNPQMPRPRLSGRDSVLAEHAELGNYRLHCAGDFELLYTENETNNARLFGGQNATRYVKDGINDHVVCGADSVNPALEGTKVAARYRLNVGASQRACIRLRLCAESKTLPAPFAAFDATFEQRRAETDEFYDEIFDPSLGDEAVRVGRQALSGMLWTKQFYLYDLERWLSEHHGRSVRNGNWAHLKNHDIVSMPDKWEYPWYATWDLAFHLIPLFLVDPDFAREQCLTFLSERYIHPSGALPAYEWDFDDVNPPVLPFAVLTIHRLLKEKNGVGDIDLLRRSFGPLSRNFEWWLREKDPDGTHSFGGGFLGLDNIGVFDRSKALPTGGKLEQADASAWMALFAQFMLQMAVELSATDERYQDEAVRFFDHVVSIGRAMDKDGELVDEMWDEADGFFYDVLRFPDGSGTRLRVRSLVGLLSLGACTVIRGDVLARVPKLKARHDEMTKKQGSRGALVRDAPSGGTGACLVSILDEDKIRKILRRMLDEEEFFGPYGIRSLSRRHLEEPFQFHWAEHTYQVGYLPGESDSGMFGGNSNWRGPVWMPTNFLLLRALVHLHEYFGDGFTVECPTGSGRHLHLADVAKEIARRLESIFLPDAAGRRPLYGGTELFQSDPHFKNLISFYEYFHGDDGSGMGASHQTGWTGLIAASIVARGKRDLIFSRLSDAK